MSNPLTEITSRTWNASAMGNALFLFRHHDVKVVIERRNHPTLPSIIVAKKAGEDWRALLKMCDRSLDPPPGSVLWNYREEGGEVVCYFAECPQKLVNTILHAATCGCDGCWNRM